MLNNLLALGGRKALLYSLVKTISSFAFLSYLTLLAQLFSLDRPSERTPGSQPVSAKRASEHVHSNGTVTLKSINRTQCSYFGLCGVTPMKESIHPKLL